MEDSFEVRVKRLFGSHLFESVPRSSFPVSSWSVADGEVERREWNRQQDADHDRSDDPCSSAFADGGCFAKRRRSRRRSFEEEFELDVDEQEDGADGEGRREEGEEDREDHDGEEAEIRSSIGLDPTLDNEDEEDEYDRAAFGREEAGERLYMSDVKKVGSYLNCHIISDEMTEEASIASRLLHRDPRADHFAATVRLKEDEQVAANSVVPDSSKHSVKPILKRKEAQNDSMPVKRVRFGLDDDGASKEPRDRDPAITKESANIPDYIRNPSRYTRYTFDSYEDDDAANLKAFEGIRSLQSDVVVDLPKSLTFTPRKKSIDAMPVDKNLGDANQIRWSTGIAAGESFETDACKMEEDDANIPSEEAEAWVTPPWKGRRYRSRFTPED